MERSGGGSSRPVPAGPRSTTLGGSGPGAEVGRARLAKLIKRAMTWVDRAVSEAGDTAQERGVAGEMLTSVQC